MKEGEKEEKRKEIKEKKISGEERGRGDRKKWMTTTPSCGDF